MLHVHTHGKDLCSMGKFPSNEYQLSINIYCYHLLPFFAKYLHHGGGYPTGVFGPEACLVIHSHGCGIIIDTFSPLQSITVAVLNMLQFWVPPTGS